MKKNHLALLYLLTPLLMGGAHCGMTNYAGPLVGQDAFFHHEKGYVSRVRFQREAPDYKSAVLTISTQTKAIVRDCEPPPGWDKVRVYAAVEGEARVTVGGTCFEVVFETPSPTPKVELATDIDRTFVLQSNCSPHGPPCRSAQWYGDGRIVGEGKGKDRWTLWSIEVTAAPAADAGPN